MSRIGCACGHVIRDQTDFLSYKARLLADEDEERFWDGMSRELADLLAATRAGNREEWISRHFLCGYPRDLDDQSLISDFMSGYAIRFMRSIYQCEQCGRLLLESLNDVNRFRSFVPESQPQPSVLKSRGEVSK